MSDHRYHHSPDRTIRTWSAVALCGATAAASIAWTVWGGLEAVGDGRIPEAVWLVAVASIVWFVVAGIGLRLVRVAERRRSPADQRVG
jgi:hypothetical protein